MKIVGIQSHNIVFQGIIMVKIDFGNVNCTGSYAACQADLDFLCRNRTIQAKHIIDSSFHIRFLLHRNLSMA